MAEKYETEVAQDLAELEALAEIFHREEVRSYLEIGVRYGGSFWRLVRTLPRGSRAVALDLPTGAGGRVDGIPIMGRCAERLRGLGYDVHFLLGDSSVPAIVERVRALGPFDAVFIDANHTLPYVMADWTNYGPMARIVAFHDIAWSRPPEFNQHIKVPQFWEKIKQDYRHEEFKLHHTGQDNGIGVLWRS